MAMQCILLFVLWGGLVILAIPLARLDILNILHGGLVFLAILLARLVFVIFLLG